MWVFVAAGTSSSWHQQGLLISVASLAESVASVVAARGLRGCGAQAQLLWGMWDLPGPGGWPVSPALAGGFLTTGPPGKFSSSFPFAILLLNTKELFLLRIRNYLLVGYCPNCRIRGELVTEHKQDQLCTKWNLGTSLVVQWLWLWASIAGATGSIPDMETKISTCCLVWPGEKKKTKTNPTTDLQELNR